MNERIQQLAEQAGFQYIKDEGIGWAGNHDASLPKFAELIMQECIDTLEFHGFDEAVPYIKWRATNRMGVRYDK